MKRFLVRFYRMRESPDVFARYFEHEIIGEDDREMLWKVHNIIKNHESMGGRIFKTKVLNIKEEKMRPTVYHCHKCKKEFRSMNRPATLKIDEFVLAYICQKCAEKSECKSF